MPLTEKFEDLINGKSGVYVIIRTLPVARLLQSASPVSVAAVHFPTPDARLSFLARSSPAKLVFPEALP